MKLMFLVIQVLRAVWCKPVLVGPDTYIGLQTVDAGAHAVVSSVNNHSSLKSLSTNQYMKYFTDSSTAGDPQTCEVTEPTWHFLRV